MRDQQHGNVWLKAHVTLRPNTNLTSYKLVFEAMIGNGIKGDVALDELVFTPNAQCPPISEQGDIVTQYCDFETDTCQFTVSGASNFQWKRTQGTDNTLQTNEGNFMKLTVINNK
jgi:hypothetical protein